MNEDVSADMKPTPAPGSWLVNSYNQASNWGRRYSLGRKLSIALTIVALGFAFATYATITGSSPLGADTINTN